MNHRDQLLWKKEAQYYYTSYKNKEALPLVIIGTVICLIFFKGAAICIPFIWLYYAYYCTKNNEALNNDPLIKKKRAAYEKYIKEVYGNEQV